MLSTLKALWLASLPRVRPRVVAALDHDPEAFTQGLAYRDGQLFESTGLAHASSLRRLSPDAATPERLVPVPGHFAEGIACRGDELTQLTFKSGVALVYRLPELALLRQLQYSGQGWGLASCGDGFVMSDGSEWLSFRDQDFALRRRLRVTARGLPMRWLNDLEYARGRIFANRLGDKAIYEIDADTGAVLRVIDCSELVARARPRQPGDVLNGIAFLADRDLFLFGGKRWPLMFLVELPVA